MNLHPAERKQNMVIFPVTFHIANHPAFRAVDSIGMCVGPSFLCFRGARELTRMLDQAVASSAEHATDRHTLNRANAAVDGYAFDPVASVPGGARGIPAGAVLVSTTEGDVKSGRCIRGVVLILLPISIQQRLQKELRMLKQDPVPGVHALPLPANMLEWHFVIEGPAASPYSGGFYHGIIRFPKEYPFKPPSIRMLTPSGRFQPDQRICLSMSDFHPETWNCMWSVASILQGVVSFMLDSAPAIGTINTSDAHKRQLARQSMRANLQDKVFCELFGDLIEDWEKANPRGLEEANEQVECRPEQPASRDANGLSGLIMPLLLLLAVVAGGLYTLLSLPPTARADL